MGDGPRRAEVYSALIGDLSVEDALLLQRWIERGEQGLHVTLDGINGTITSVVDRKKASPELLSALDACLTDE